MIDAGFVRSLCLSEDSICVWLGRPIFNGHLVLTAEQIALALPNWNATHLFERILPKLKELGVRDSDVDTMLVENPIRYFQGDEPPR
jgi:phosphotriesterase-related protein